MAIPPFCVEHSPRGIPSGWAMWRMTSTDIRVCTQNRQASCSWDVFYSTFSLALTKVQSACRSHLIFCMLSGLADVAHDHNIVHMIFTLVRSLVSHDSRFGVHVPRVVGSKWYLLCLSECVQHQHRQQRPIGVAEKEDIRREKEDIRREKEDIRREEEDIRREEEDIRREKEVETKEFVGCCHQP